jgi:hypothetical protein
MFSHHRRFGVAASNYESFTVAPIRNELDSQFHSDVSLDFGRFLHPILPLCSFDMHSNLLLTTHTNKHMHNSDADMQREPQEVFDFIGGRARGAARKAALDPQE